MPPVIAGLILRPLLRMHKLELLLIGVAAAIALGVLLIHSLTGILIAADA